MEASFLWNCDVVVVVVVVVVEDSADVVVDVAINYRLLLLLLLLLLHHAATHHSHARTFHLSLLTHLRLLDVLSVVARLVVVASHAAAVVVVVVFGLNVPNKIVLSSCGIGAFITRKALFVEVADMFAPAVLANKFTAFQTKHKSVAVNMRSANRKIF